MSGWNAYTWYWFIWFFGAVLTFLPVEIYALCTDVNNTLSANVWRLEGFIPGVPGPWSAGHFLFTGSFILLAVWLIGHFGWGIWR